jgi:hypothetical protein
MAGGVSVGGRRRVAAHGALAAVVVLLGLLGTGVGSGLLPGCPIYGTFHVLCPGCGATRAVAALLRGHWREAWGFNPLLVAALPGMLGYWAVAYARALRGGEMPRVRPVAIWMGMVLAVGFAVARNFPAGRG